MVLVPALLWAGAVGAQNEPTGQTMPDHSDALDLLTIGGPHTDLPLSDGRHGLQAKLDVLYGDYSRRKLRVQQQTGLQWSLDLSLLQQWGGPNGGSPALQLLAGLSMSYGAFRNDAIGAGSIQFAANLAAYATTRTGADIGSSLGIVSAINDWPVSQSDFAQLTYTQTLPDNRLSFSIGQFPFANFDGNRYLDNQQQDFVNLVFTQNGSASYPAAGVGASAQWQPSQEIQFALAFQEPNTASLATQSSSGYRRGDLAWLGYAQWSPSVPGLGPGQYSLAYYESPTPGQPRASRGWSFNAVQDLDRTWALFGRANFASSVSTSIGTSYALGIAIDDPLRRSPTDQAAVAIGYSIPHGAPAKARDETIVETYWSWTLFGGLLLTPDVQLILDPALDPDSDTVWVLSLRTTLMF